MRIKITTNDSDVFTELKAEADNPSRQMPANTLIGTPRKAKTGMPAFTVPDVIEFTLAFAGSVGAGVLSAWLYDLVKNRVSKLTVETEDVGISLAEIHAALEKHMQKRES